MRIDDAVMQTSEGWARLLRGQRNIGDFTRWSTTATKRVSSGSCVICALKTQDSNRLPAPQARSCHQKNYCPPSIGST